MFNKLEDPASTYLRAKIIPVLQYRDTLLYEMSNDTEVWLDGTAKIAPRT
jgi:hypothetical protein